MKKNLINYYAVIMLLLYLFYNVLLKPLKIGGLLYLIFMIILIIVNGIILILYRKKIKYKQIVCVLYFLTCLLSKNFPQICFNFSNIILLIGIGFIESTFMKVFAIITTLLICIFWIPLYLFIHVFSFNSFDGDSRRSYIYKDTHYYCDYNNDVYAYSAGAFDRYHYNIDKNYKILNINGIIYVYVSYSEKKDISENEYYNYLNTHKCRLVGD